MARYRGTGTQKPILLLAHLDTVPARREDWSFDPFKLLEKDGYFYGRGTDDDKLMAAIFISNLIRYKNEGYKPDRDIVVALETDEEIGDTNIVGLQWLIKNHRDLIEAEYALNEGGGVRSRNGKELRNEVETSQKVFVDYRFEVKNPGGHSSMPSKDNAIYHLAAGLTRLAQFDFPLMLNETTRTWLNEAAAPEEDKQIGGDMLSVASEHPDPAASARLSAKPAYNARLRTTCVATLLKAGLADNALPESAQATINCRVLPGEPLTEVQKTLIRVLNDDQISVIPSDVDVDSPLSPLNPKIFGAVKQATAKFWPGIPVIPTMGKGSSDAKFLRNAGIPTYGTGRPENIDDIRAHGNNERVLIESFYEGLEYYYYLVKVLSSGK